MINPFEHFLYWVDDQVVGDLGEKVGRDWKDEAHADGLEEAEDGGEFQLAPSRINRKYITVLIVTIVQGCWESNINFHHSDRR